VVLSLQGESRCQRRRQLSSPAAAVVDVGVGDAKDAMLKVEVQWNGVWILGGVAGMELLKKREDHLVVWGCIQWSTMVEALDATH